MKDAFSSLSCSQLALLMMQFLEAAWFRSAWIRKRPSLLQNINQKVPCVCDKMSSNACTSQLFRLSIEFWPWHTSRMCDKTKSLSLGQAFSSPAVSFQWTHVIHVFNQRCEWDVGVAPLETKRHECSCCCAQKWDMRWGCNLQLPASSCPSGVSLAEQIQDGYRCF